MGLSVGLGVPSQVPVGVVSAFAGVNAPAGWLMCAGQAVSRTDYSALFNALSTTYGSGDGSTTFNLPDLRGRVPAGVDNMGGSAASRLTSTVLTASNTLGATGGAQTVTLSSAEMPSHTHTQDAHSHNRGVINTGASAANPGQFIASAAASVFYANNGSGYTGDSTGTGTAVATNQSTGGGGAHTNTQPTLVLNYIIKATQ
jgi:microcystin-dependent protein